MTVTTEVETIVLVWPRRTRVEDDQGRLEIGGLMA
jgi:hypothetical protein